jgi:hypothetical protein
MAAVTAARPPKLRSRPRLRALAAAPPEEVADGVWLLRGGLLRTMSVYLVRDDERGGVLVFDAGEKGMAPSIVAAAIPRGGISRVVLGHERHRPPRRRAGLACLRRCPLPPGRRRQAQGSRGGDYWRPQALPLDVRLLHAFAHRFVWDGGPVHVDGTVREGDRLAGFARCGGLFIQASTTARALLWPLASTSPSHTNLRSAWIARGVTEAARPAQRPGERSSESPQAGAPPQLRAPDVS